MPNFYLRTRDDFDGCLRRGCINDLRFTSLGSDFNCVVKYQRMLVEQLFNRLFHKEGELSMVIKIEVEKDSLDRSIEVFCLVEDLRHKLTQTCRHLKELKLEEDRQELYLLEGEKKVYVDDMSVFHSLFSNSTIIQHKCSSCPSRPSPQTMPWKWSKERVDWSSCTTERRLMTSHLT